jgi:hypothetical protein
MRRKPPTEAKRRETLKVQEKDDKRETKSEQLTNKIMYVEIEHEG